MKFTISSASFYHTLVGNLLRPGDLKSFREAKCYLIISLHILRFNCFYQYLFYLLWAKNDSPGQRLWNYKKNFRIPFCATCQIYKILLDILQVNSLCSCSGCNCNFKEFYFPYVIYSQTSVHSGFPVLFSQAHVPFIFVLG